MEKIEYYSLEELNKVERKLIFFFQGDNGLFRTNELGIGSYISSSLDMAAAIKITSLITNHEKSEKNFNLLNIHVENQLTMQIKEQEDLIRKLSDSSARIKELNEMKKALSNATSFQNQIDKILEICQ